MELFNKHIYFFNDQWYLRSRNNPGGISFSNYVDSNDYFHKYTVLFGKFNRDEFIKNCTDTIKDKSVLYFDRSSQMPRLKVQISSFKRCIKIDKADYIVIGNYPTVYTFGEEYNIYETQQNYYAISKSMFERFFNSNLEIMKALCKENLNDLVLIYQGPIFATDNINLISNGIDGVYNKPFVLDNVVNDMISENLPDLSANEASAIIDMLTSKDLSLGPIAIKMLDGFNLKKYRLTGRLILVLGNSNEQNITSDFLYKSLCIPKFKYNNYLYYNPKELEEPNVKYTKEDFEVCHELCRSNEYLKRVVEKLQEKDIKDVNWIPDEYKK